MSDVALVEIVRPRYVVEVGQVERTRMVGRDLEEWSWSFRFAFDLLSDARAAARRLAEEHEHVRVVDRDAEGCSECMPGEGLLPSARVLLDGCACGLIPVSEIRARGEVGAAHVSVVGGSDE